MVSTDLPTAVSAGACARRARLRVATGPCLWQRAREGGFGRIRIIRDWQFDANRSSSLLTPFVERTSKRLIRPSRTSRAAASFNPANRFWFESFTRAALHVELASQKSDPFPHSCKSKGVLSLKRLFDMEADSVVFDLQSKYSIGRS